MLTLSMGASVVVAELRDPLNTIWDIPVREERGLLGEVVDIVRRRVVAFTLVLGTGLLLLVSLVLNAGILAAGSYFQDALPWPEPLLQLFNFAVSLVVTSIVLALVFRFVPDWNARWGEIAIGAAITGIFFSIGKSNISVYIGKSSLGSAYGAAGSLPILLGWIYYSSQIFFFGAVFVRVYAQTVQREALVCNPLKDFVPQWRSGPWAPLKFGYVNRGRVLAYAVTNRKRS